MNKLRENSASQNHNQKARIVIAVSITRIHDCQTSQTWIGNPCVNVCWITSHTFHGKVNHVETRPSKRSCWSHRQNDHVDLTIKTITCDQRLVFCRSCGMVHISHFHGKYCHVGKHFSLHVRKIGSRETAPFQQVENPDQAGPTHQGGEEGDRKRCKGAHT